MAHNFFTISDNELIFMQNMIFLFIFSTIGLFLLMGLIELFT